MICKSEDPGVGQLASREVRPRCVPSSWREETNAYIAESGFGKQHFGKIQKPLLGLNNVITRPRD